MASFQADFFVFLNAGRHGISVDRHVNAGELMKQPRSNPVGMIDFTQWTLKKCLDKNAIPTGFLSRTSPKTRIYIRAYIDCMPPAFSDGVNI